MFLFNTLNYYDEDCIELVVSFQLGADKIRSRVVVFKKINKMKWNTVLIELKIIFFLLIKNRNNNNC